MSKRSPIAGIFNGTHGFNSSNMIGFGKLSRLRFSPKSGQPESEPETQFAQMRPSNAYLP